MPVALVEGRAERSVLRSRHSNAERLREYVECASLRLGIHFGHAGDRRRFSHLPGGSVSAMRCASTVPSITAIRRVCLPPSMPEPRDPTFAEKFIDACAPLQRERRPGVSALHELSRAGGRSAGVASSFSRAAFSGAGAG